MTRLLSFDSRVIVLIPVVMEAAQNGEDVLAHQFQVHLQACYPLLALKLGSLDPHRG